MSVLHPQLVTLRDELEAATTRARRLVDSTDDAGFGRRPEPGAWSAAECVEHISLTTRAYLPLMDEALAAAPAGAPVPDDRTYSRDWIGALLAWTLEPPYRMKVKTLAPFVPDEVRDREAVFVEFAGLQKDVEARLREASGRELEKIKVRSPFSSRMRYNLFSTFGILAAHERRHLWQAERTLARTTPAA